MTKITATKMVEEEIEFDVDDRIYDEDCIAWKIVDIIFEGALKRKISDLYNDDYNVVKWAVLYINDAFKKADKIMEL